MRLNMRSFIMLTCLLMAGSSYATISATISPTQAALGSTLTLTITATDGDDIGQPDLSGLAPDFRVLGQASSSNYRFVNGKASSSKQLKIRLMPKHTGQLTIPALQAADGKTAALTVTIAQRAASGNLQTQAASANLFVRTKVSPQSVYVGQQTTVTVDLYYDTNLSGGSLEKPAIDNASLHELGKPQRFTTNINGRMFNVYQQQYALVAATAGKLVIPAITFQGQTVTAGTSGFFGMQVPGFGTPTPVSAASSPVTLNVKPKPADWQGAWLPAHKVTLGMSGIPDTPTLTVGTPINLKLSLTAIGLPASQLPDLSLPDIKGAAVYASSAKSQTSQVGGMLKGEKSRGFAIMPQQPGKLTLPPTRLAWFNTTSGKKEVINLPARHFTVVAAAAATSPAVNKTDTTPRSNTLTPEPATSHNTAAIANAGTRTATVATPAVLGVSHYWRLAFFISMALWLAVIIGWLLGRYRALPARPMGKPTKTPPKGSARKRFMHQLKEEDPTLLATLLAWAQQERPTIHSLHQLKASLIETQRHTIERLESWRYGEQHQPLPAGVKHAFDKGLQWLPEETKVAPLAPLYPPTP